MLIVEFVAENVSAFTVILPGDGKTQHPVLPVWMLL
jgi:hypothetical protein